MTSSHPSLLTFKAHNRHHRGHKSSMGGCAPLYLGEIAKIEINYKLNNMNVENIKVLARTVKSSSMGVLVIKPVEKATGKKLIIENHYSHKWNDGGFGKYNFGIFKQGSEECLGVAVYGYMKNCKAKIFTHPNPDAWVCELNRMWIDDKLGKNAESILISHSIKLLRAVDPNIVAVQSFADGRLGCGTIYKAANFRYYGFHYTRFLRNKRTGEITHEQCFTNSSSRVPFIKNNVAYLNHEFDVFAVKTYRYIYPLCKHFASMFKEEPYPPYDKGELTVEWRRDKERLKERMKTVIDSL